MSALPEQYLSLEDYFKLDETGDCKHEYLQGAIFDMHGASENHNLIAMAVGINLGVQLRGKPCRPYPGDFRLKIEAMSLYTYPDLSVICGDTQLADGRRDTFLNPTVLVEVLSDSTEAYDRGKKAEYYRTIPSLREYLFIAQDRPHVERYRRQGNDWLFTEYSTLADEVALDSIGCTLSVAAIYEQVEFDVSKENGE
ncbi:MAG TPA: Uma2 family endonuclease [Armatimonadota bacterium]|jgi:Uma2 family endonuclease